MTVDTINTIIRKVGAETTVDRAVAVLIHGLLSRIDEAIETAVDKKVPREDLQEITNEVNRWIEKLPTITAAVTANTGAK